MKRISAIFSLLILTLTSAVPAMTVATTSQGDDRGHPVLQLGANKIEVDHGRPALRGRTPEQMIQPGQVWRMGSNDPTTLTTQTSLKFGDQAVAAGKYTLQAKFIEAQNWHLMIVSDGGSLMAEVPFVLQKADKPVESLTITLEKKDKGGRLILQWGTLALATDFQPAVTVAAAQDGDKWKELTAFHDVMSATFHPMEEGDLKPIRSRALEMAAKAKQWADSTAPRIYDRPEISAGLSKLVEESNALASLVSNKADDAHIKTSLTTLHQRFHEIAGMCSDAKKQNH